MKFEGFWDKYSCLIYQLEACSCPAEKPCEDAVIVNTRVANKCEVNDSIKGCYA
jgi:hypothetical protein